MAKSSAVTRKGLREQLATYPDVVLRAALEAEERARFPRPVFISLLEAELKRRVEAQPRRTP